MRAGPLDKLNVANTVLVPKTDTAEQLKDFRPISLIHSFAKLITKILARRLAAHIQTLVSNAVRPSPMGQLGRTKFVTR